MIKEENSTPRKHTKWNEYLTLSPDSARLEWDSSKITERKRSVGEELPKLPMTSDQILANFRHMLTENEVNEIKDFQIVYYLGPT